MLGVLPDKLVEIQQSPVCWGAAAMSSLWADGRTWWEQRSVQGKEVAHSRSPGMDACPCFGWHAGCVSCRCGSGMQSTVLLWKFTLAVFPCYYEDPQGRIDGRKETASHKMTAPSAAICDENAVLFLFKFSYFWKQHWMEENFKLWDLGISMCFFLCFK